MPTIIYERCGARIVRLTKCKRCDGDVYIRANASSGSGLLCMVCKKKVKHG